MEYKPTFVQRNIYRYLTYIVTQNHCMAVSCTDCSFCDYTHTDGIIGCQLVDNDWDSIRRDISPNLTEREIYNLLKLTDLDTDGCDNECYVCKFGVYNTKRGHWACAPFSVVRNMCNRMLDYKKEYEET